MPADIRSGDFAVPFLVSAEVMMAAVAAYCSSPQTTEINASSRAGTLMKWVYLGLGVGAGLVAIAAIGEPKSMRPVIFGGALTGATLGVSYVYAKQSGLKSDEPGTETGVW